MLSKTQIVFSCSRFKVEEANDNPQSTYALPPNAAGIIVLDEQSRILLTREYRPKTGKIHWRIPAGRLEQGEDFITGARRELREESGFDAKELVPFFEYETLSGWYKQRKAFFVAKGLFSAPLDTGDEEFKPELHFLAPAEVLKLLNDGEICDDIAAALYRFLHVYKLI